MVFNINSIFLSKVSSLKAECFSIRKSNWKHFISQAQADPERQIIFDQILYKFKRNLFIDFQIKKAKPFFSSR